MSEDFIDMIIDRWRGATMSTKQNGLEGGDFESLARDEFSTVSVVPQAPSIHHQPTFAPAPQPAFAAPPPAAPRTLDPDRFRLLKKPIEGASPLGAPGAPRFPR
jgi:hypothetical protein